MKVGKQEDFALIFMGFLAKSYSQNYISLAEIAQKTCLSRLFMKHVAVKLKEKNLVESKEGIGGGYRLASQPKNIYISQILKAVSDKVITTSCYQGKCRIKKLKKGKCLCSVFWDKVDKNVEDYLEKFSLAKYISL